MRFVRRGMRSWPTRTFACLFSRKATTIKLIGDNFQPSYRVLFAGETRKPKYVSDQQLLLELAAEELTTARSITVLVFSPEKEEIRSNAIELVVELET